MTAKASVIAKLPAYDLADVEIGVAHIGLGAFHRAHQASYFDDMLERSWRYGLSVTSIHSSTATAALRAQGCRYGLALLAEEPSYRLICAVRESIDPGDDAFVQRIAHPSTHLVTLTVTEKGYCLGADGALNGAHPDILRDLAGSERPRTAIGLLTRALDARRQAGARGLAVVSCDNLAGNGERLRDAVAAFALEVSPDLRSWIEDEIVFANSMVDSITPATDSSARAKVSAAVGFDDACAVQREPFTAWVIDASLQRTHAELETAGVLFSRDVSAHERAKLRMLNGPHSTLAYVGLACGYDTVAAAMADAEIAGFMDSLMRVEIGPGVTAVDIDVDAYRRDLLRRFSNPSVKHLLKQIAIDGSQKLPIRLLQTIAENLQAGRPIARLCIGVAAWMRFVVRAQRDGVEIADPLSGALLNLARMTSGAPAQDVATFLTLRAVFADEIASAPQFKSALEQAYAVMLDIERHAGALSSLNNGKTER